MNPGLLAIRADASPATGSGHVMRCLALGQAWRQAGGEVLFVMAEVTPALERRLGEEGCRIARVDAPPGSLDDLNASLTLLAREAPEWVVLDGYPFDARYQSELKGRHRLLVVDDNGGVEQYSADIVVNQNVHATEAMYARRGEQTRLLLGPQYAMLRNEFAAYREWRREISAAGNRVLLTMGGSDPGDFAPRILPRLAELPVAGLQIRAVVGGSAGNADVVKKLAADFEGRIQVIVDAHNMPEWMAWADLAIAGAGTTCWELCLMGLPAILLEAAENQRLIARHMEAAGSAVNAGPSADVDCVALAQRAREILMSADARLAMSQAGRKLVDGLGRERVLEAMRRVRTPCD